MIEAKIGTGYAMVILDPAYKILGERVENSNEDMAIVLNEIERLSINTGAAVVVAAHFSKGNQSGKAHLDRVSGAGAWARDPDVFMTMTPHTKDGCLVVETTVRDHKPVEPFVVEWSHPLTIRREELDPEDLKKAGGRPEAISTDEIIKLFGNQNSMTRKELLRACDKKNVSEPTLDRKLKELVKIGELTTTKGSGIYFKT